MGNTQQVMEKKLKNDIHWLNQLMKYQYIQTGSCCPQHLFNSKFEVEYISKEPTFDWIFGCHNDLNQRVIRMKIVHYEGDYEYVQSIMINERQLYELTHYFKLLNNTPQEKDAETVLESDNRCEICFEKQITNKLPCGHYYCESCIQTWFLKQGKYRCAFCRRWVKKSSLFSEYIEPKKTPQELKQQIFDVLNRASKNQFD